MAKSKKDIDAFQKAMLSNTKVIGTDNDEKNQASGTRPDSKEETAPVENPMISIETLKEYEKFAKELNIKPDEIIELALRYFLDLKEFMKN